jgi:hypothetical protein
MHRPRFLYLKGGIILKENFFPGGNFYLLKEFLLVQKKFLLVQKKFLLA